MNSSLKLGKIAGIDLKIHMTFFLLLIFTAFSTLFSGGTTVTMLTELAFILALFLFVILHELGHALVARRFGYPTQDIVLLPIGGMARMELPDKPGQELLVALAGPLVNLLLAGAFLVGLLLSGFFTQPLSVSLLTENIWMRLTTVNITLALFNLIPAFPMDGGRVLRALLASRMNRVKATQTAATVGKVIAIIMGIVGFFLNPWLVITALFIWWGANREAQSVTTKAKLQGLTVRDAMISQFHKVEANQSLESVMELSMQTGQMMLPVTSNGHFLGFIHRNDLMPAIQKLGRRSPAYASISVEPAGLTPETPLVETLPKFSASSTLPVIEGGQLIGLVTPEGIQQVIWLRENHWPEEPPQQDQGYPQTKSESLDG
ncbi:site-2 protease family protein [bacterium]|nr:site-2 protease family protein [bacterium]